jgi:hypothetical protein
LGAEARGGERACCARAAKCVRRCAPFEERDDQRGRESVARGSAVDRLDLRRCRPGDLAAVLKGRRAAGAARDSDQLPPTHDLVLELLHDEQVRFDVDRPGGRRVELEERRRARRGEDDLVGNFELAEERSADGARRERGVRAGTTTI